MSEKGNLKINGAKTFAKKEKEQKNYTKADKNKKKTQAYENVWNNQLRLNDSAEPNFITIERQLVLTFSDGEKEFQYIRTKSALFSFLKSILEPTNDTYYNEERHVAEINILPKTKKKTEPSEDEEEDPIHLFVSKQINEALLKYHMQRKGFIDLKQNAIDLGEKTPNISIKNKKDTMQKNKLKPKNTYTQRNTTNLFLSHPVAANYEFQTQEKPIGNEFLEFSQIADTSKVEPSVFYKSSPIPLKTDQNKRKQFTSHHLAANISKEKGERQFFKKMLDKFRSIISWKPFYEIAVIFNIVVLIYVKIYYANIYNVRSFIFVYSILWFTVIYGLAICYVEYVLRQKNLANKLGRFYLIGFLTLLLITIIYPNVIFSKIKKQQSQHL